MNGMTLAYLGDAYYELYVRSYFINQGFTDVGILHQKSVQYTSSYAQANVVSEWINHGVLTEQEIDVYKRGRNVSAPKRKNVDAKTYHQATGFEAVVGWLYINDKMRLDVLMNLILSKEN